MSRIRHCVECPHCRTRYLLSFSPYRNGSYLVPTVKGGSDEYVLYCACRKGSACTRWRWNELQRYEVVKAAYERGYGTPEEIMAEPRKRWQVDAISYVHASPHFAHGKKLF